MKSEKPVEQYSIEGEGAGWCSPSFVCAKWIGKISGEYRFAFLSAFLMGLFIHMPVMLSDIPNHDGLGSLYFDQNMITSGRWFLTIACGFSTYFTIPWVIGLLGILFLALTCVVLTGLFGLKDRGGILLTAGLLVSFPALASTFAYVFTLDGYMLALLLAVLSVWCVSKVQGARGICMGAVCLAFSLGTYQAYLPFAVLLCVYEILRLFMGETLQKTTRGKIKAALRYLFMGILGAVLYYGILQVLLKLEGKTLDTYQGINGLGTSSGLGVGTLISMFRDFLSFSVKGNVLFNNVFSAVALVGLVLAAVWVFGALAKERKWWKSPWFFVIITGAVCIIPFGTNIILLVSPNVTYHLLMRYQWVVLLLCLFHFVLSYAKTDKGGMMAVWVAHLAAFVLVFNYALSDNIGYSNLEKRYEKTYAYCVRLLDRMEQTEGYYQGIPIAMVGVVGYNPFPETDITLSVTSNMIGLSGDTLLYTGENYQVFMKNYLGATLNILSPEETKDIYFSEEYIAMESFPAASSVKVVDGIMYVKTENVGRD